jgi:hypothetical protein
MDMMAAPSAGKSRLLPQPMELPFPTAFGACQTFTILDPHGMQQAAIVVGKLPEKVVYCEGLSHVVLPYEEQPSKTHYVRQGDRYPKEELSTLGCIGWEPFPFCGANALE